MPKPKRIPAPSNGAKRQGAQNAALPPRKASLLTPKGSIRPDPARAIRSKDTGGNATVAVPAQPMATPSPISRPRNHQSTGQHINGPRNSPSHVTVEQLANRLGIKVKQIVRVAPSLGIDVNNGNTKLSVGDAARLTDFFHRHGPKAPGKPPPILVVLPPVPEPRAIPTSSLDYDWPGKVSPFTHQVKTTEFLVKNNRAFCLNDMGTGKTLSVLWAYDYLRRAGLVKSMLVICPLSTMVRTWKDEIETHFRHTRFAVLHGAAAERRRLLRGPADIYIINHDGIKTPGLVALINQKPDLDLIVVDEVAQVARTSGTARYKALKLILNENSERRAWGLTGTPIPNSPTDVWAQSRLLFPGNTSVSPMFKTFERDISFRREKLQTPRWGRDHRQITHMLFQRTATETLELAYQAMQPAIRFKRDECISLPPLVTETREVEMSPEQVGVYREMLVRLRAEFESGQITAGNELVKANKLLQIACGVPYADGGGSISLPIDERLSAVEEIIEQAGYKVIVFVPFVAALKVISDYLSKKFSVATMNGSTPKDVRDKIFDAFQQAENPRVLIAQPASMSHGLTLTAANTIVWFSPIWSNEISTQANCRITRPGQKNNQLIVNIQGSSIERRVYSRLREKGRVQGLLLEMLADRNAWFDTAVA